MEEIKQQIQMKNEFENGIEAKFAAFLRYLTLSGFGCMDENK